MRIAGRGDAERSSRGAARGAQLLDGRSEWGRIGRTVGTFDDSGRLRLLYELGCAFAARVELDDLVSLVVRKCREVLDAEGAAVLLLDPQRHELYFPYVADDDPAVATRLRQLRFPADHGIAGAVLRSGRPLRVDDVAQDPRFYAGVDRRSGLTTRNILTAPLTARQGAIGVLQVLNHRDGNFSDADLDFLDALAGSVAVAIENARMYAQLKQQVAALEQAVHEHNDLVALRRELDIASSIQQSILPRTFPPFPDRLDFQIFAAMIPAREVGGDFYDFFFVDHERLALVIGDVSGKGVPAAIFMAVSRTALKSTALAGQPPDACLRQVNNLLCLDNRAELFVTIFYGILNTRTGELAYCNGGHNPPYVLRRDGSIELLPHTGGTVLGVLDDLQYQAKQATVIPGESIFLYTDGVTEAMNADGALFSEARLRAALLEVHGESPEAVIRSVVERVNHHAGTVAQSDDITVLCVKRAAACAATGITLTNRLTELERVSHLVEEFGARHGLPAKIVFETNLALEEILTNVIAYAYDDGQDHEIAVRLALADDELTVEVEDDGRPFNPLDLPAADVTLAVEDRPIGGLGVHLVRHVMSGLEYCRQQGKNILVLKKHVGAS
jgi:serine phosphatase RsbU (regulator of sigma subunit)/anti-sigma regulatory factor (Ser/Thr protein kinase)